MLHDSFEVPKTGEQVSHVVVSDEFRQEIARASVMRVGEAFLFDGPKPSRWSRRLPFAYGLGPETGGFNCSGYLIRVVSDVLGRTPQAGWNPQFRTSNDFLRPVEEVGESVKTARSLRETKIGDAIITVANSFRDKNRWIGNHTMVAAEKFQDNALSLRIFHAEIDNGIQARRIYGGRDRVRVPLEAIIATGVKDSGNETF